jgi:hypothetical protein
MVGRRLPAESPIVAPELGNAFPNFRTSAAQGMTNLPATTRVRFTADRNELYNSDRKAQ